MSSEPTRPADEPVAWMYELAGEQVLLTERLRGGVLRSERGWTETPLFAHPPQQADAGVVEALKSVPLPSTMGTAEEHYRRFYSWYNDIAAPALSRAQAPASQPAQEMVERLARTLGDTELDFLGEPLRMNATREDLERLACAILTALPQAQAAGDEKLREAVTKIRDGYKSQMRFCDIDPLPYFRDFVRKLDVALRTEKEG